MYFGHISALCKTTEEDREGDAGDSWKMRSIVFDATACRSQEALLATLPVANRKLASSGNLPASQVLNSLYYELSPGWEHFWNIIV